MKMTMSDNPSVHVEKTLDIEFLRRWMLKPSFLSMMGVKINSQEADSEFNKLVKSRALFFRVMVNASEKGCIIMKQIANGLELHLCLATWYSHTRTALKKALSLLSKGTAVYAIYPRERESVERLLTDVGFGDPTASNNWSTRVFLV